MKQARADLWSSLWALPLRAAAAVQTVRIPWPNVQQQADRELAIAWTDTHPTETMHEQNQRKRARCRAWEVAFGDLADILRHRLTQRSCRLGTLPYLSTVKWELPLDPNYSTGLLERQAEAWAFLHGGREELTVQKTFQAMEQEERGLPEQQGVAEVPAVVQQVANV